MKLLSVLFLSFLAFQLPAQDTLVVGGPENRIQDAWVWSYNIFADVNFGVEDPVAPELHQVLRSEVWQWEAGKDDTIRGLMQFNIPDIKADQILSAELNLWYFSNVGFTQQVGDNALDIHLITEEWKEEEITWNNQPAFDGEALVSLPRSSSITQDYTGIDVSEVIKAYLNTGAHGILLKLNKEQSFAGLSFASSEHPNTALHPTLKIVIDDGTHLPEATETGMHVFPNPAQEVLHVAFPTEGLHELSLIDLQGKVRLELSTALTEVQLSVADLPKGLYVLRTLNEGGMQQQSVLIR